MLLEIVTYSAVLSPAVLFNASKEKSQLFVGHSIIQGNNLLVVSEQKDPLTNAEKRIPPSAQFNLDELTYTFYGVHLPEISLRENTLKYNHIEIVTRRGIVASFGGEVELVDFSESILFNRYRLEGNLKNTSFNVELGPEYSLMFVLLIIAFTIIASGILYILFNGISKILERKIHSPIKDWIILAIIFMPFLLSVIIPATLNYYYTMGFALLYTDSHLLAMIFSILVPVNLSVLIVLRVADHFAKSITRTEQDLPDDNSSDATFFSKRDKWAVVIGAISFLSYFYFVNFVLPLNFQAKITHELIWYLIGLMSSSVVVFLIYSCLLHYMDEYTEIKDWQLLAGVKCLESKVGNKIRVFVKQRSEEEINAWVYTLKSLFSRQICIYLTEGVVKSFNWKEITAVLAHEIGHIKLNHHKSALLLALPVTFAMGTVIFFSRKFMLSFGWWQMVVILIVYVFMMLVVIRWLPNLVYKKLEFVADEYAAKLLSDKELYVNTLMKLHEIKLHELDHSESASSPRREWNETHPSLQKRIDRLNKVFATVKNHG